MHGPLLQLKLANKRVIAYLHVLLMLRDVVGTRSRRLSRRSGSAAHINCLMLTSVPSTSTMHDELPGSTLIVMGLCG